MPPTTEPRTEAGRREAERAIVAALPKALAAADEAGSDENDWDGSEYVARLGGELLPTVLSLTAESFAAGRAAALRSDVDNLMRAVDAVIALHDRPNTHDGAAMPMCWECGSQKPCPTLNLLSFFRGFALAAHPAEAEESHD